MSVGKIWRIDRSVARIVLNVPRVDAASGVAPATITPEGYLEADIACARDGLLQYSDGKNTWLERRDRAFLECLAASPAAIVVTDDHPEVMVSAETWPAVARGVSIAPITVTDPDEGGVSYARTRIRISDVGLLQKIQTGEACEVSIGFRSEVVPIVAAPDGAAAFQRAPELNHFAIVTQGRSGPAVRVLLDAAAVPVYDQSVQPTDAIEIQGPLGPVMVPTWVAAQLQELAEMKAAAVAAPPAPVAPAVEAAPAPAPVEPAVEAAPPPPPPAAAPEEEEEEESKDAVSVLVRRRARLERLAALAALPDDVYSLDDAGLARAYVAAKIPNVSKTRLDSADLPALLGMVDVAEAAPVASAKSGPWPIRAKADTADSTTDTAAEFLKAQGY